MLNTCDIFNLLLNIINERCKNKKKIDEPSMSKTMNAFELLQL